MGSTENIERTVKTSGSKYRVSIPRYSFSEELISSISHGVGALLGIAALVLCIVEGAKFRDAWYIVAVCIYGATQIILYTMSTIYHALKINRAKRIFRVLDHCSVFLLIAGTYTPFTLVSLRGPVGWTLFGVIWGLAVLGIVFNSINVDRYQVVSGIINVLMGWAVIFAIRPLYHALGQTGLVLLLAGGVSYSVGAILYALGSKIKYMHPVFHFFVVGGGVLQFFSILLYVM